MNIEDTSYQADPSVSWDRSLHKWRTTAPVCTLWNGVLILVPAGFITDLATIPWPFTTIPGTTAYGDYNRAAIIHDYIYSLRGQLNEAGISMTRKETDQLFLSIMLEDGVAAWRAWCMYLAVRIAPNLWGKF